MKDKVKQARRAKRVAEGHQLEIGAQRAPRFLVIYIYLYVFICIVQRITKNETIPHRSGSMDKAGGNHCGDD